MQLPYIDDRRMALYGKVMALFILDIYFLWLKLIADIIDVNTFHFLNTGIWWLFNSQDVGSNR